MHITLSSILVGAAIAGVLSIVDAPPNFNVAPSCKAAAAINQAMDLAVSQGYQSCMDDEEFARTELAQGWNTYPADAKTRCVGQAADGEMQSYVERSERQKIHRACAECARAV